MLILLPISRADSSLAVKLADHIHRLGGVKRHDLVLFYAGKQALEAADQIEDILVKDFNTIVKVDSLVTEESGWPKSANMMFRNAIRWLERDSGYTGPAYFFEADNVPLKPSWADELQDEYLRQQVPVLGVIHDTVWTLADGKRVGVGGKHVVGTAIYTIPMTPYSRLWKHITPQGRTPFDVFLENELAPKAGHTDLIQHNWSTKNYRREKGKIVCDADDGRPGSCYEQPVRSDAVVLHGCKDGSLFDLFKPATPAK